MTFEDYFNKYLNSHNHEPSPDEAWAESRFQTMVEVSNWLDSKRKWWKAMNCTPGVEAILQELLIIMMANVARGGEWSTSVLMKND